MMTISRAAELWGVSRPTIYAWIKAKLIAAERVDGGNYAIISTVPPASAKVLHAAARTLKRSAGARAKVTKRKRAK